MWWNNVTIPYFFLAEKRSQFPLTLVKIAARRRTAFSDPSAHLVQAPRDKCLRHCPSSVPALQISGSAHKSQRYCGVCQAVSWLHGESVKGSNDVSIHFHVPGSSANFCDTYTYIRSSAPLISVDRPNCTRMEETVFHGLNFFAAWNQTAPHLPILS